MNKQDLIKFCDNPSNPKIKNPWSMGEYSYSTNGIILVRVSRIADIPENPEAPNPMFLFKPVEYRFFDIPACDYLQEDCKVCNGAGRNAKCPECKGDGFIELSNDYNEYEVDCKSCDGEKIVEFCEECNGTGKRDHVKRIPIADTFYQAKYLVMLHELGCRQIGIANSEAPAYFEFNDGDGLLMPVGGY